MSYSALSAAALAFVMITAPIAATPVLADGSFSLSIVPRGETAEFVRLGLGIYSVIEGEKNTAKVKQKGRRNGAGIGQSGRGNIGYIDQDGRGHGARLSQEGYNNAFGLFQTGRRANANIVQRGNGEVGLMWQHGW